MLITVVLLILLSAIITYSLIPFTICLAQKFELVDNPKVRSHPAHTHKGIIPRAGGLPIYLGIFLPALVFLPFNKQIPGILFAAAILIIVGLWDDKKNRSPYIRFFTNALAALAVVFAGISIPYITNPFGGILHLYGVFAYIFAFLWIIWTTNIIGWSGGVDGQLPGFVAISAIIIGLLSLRFVTQDSNQIQVTYLSFLTAGAFLGFLPWNFYPQKIMPGYGGKTLAGFMLAILSILSFSKLGTALLVLAVPMTDAIFMMVKRILSGRSPIWATSGHLHHHLLSLGWGKKKVAFFYWIVSIIAGVTALVVNSKQKIFVGILILILIVAFILWINFLQRLPTRKENEEF